MFDFLQLKKPLFSQTRTAGELVEPEPVEPTESAGELVEPDLLKY